MLPKEKLLHSLKKIDQQKIHTHTPGQITVSLWCWVGWQTPAQHPS